MVFICSSGWLVQCYNHQNIFCDAVRLFLESAMWHSALLGAVLLVVADYAAMRVLAPFQIPVGLAAGGGRGVYMLWLCVSAVVYTPSAAGK